MRKPTSIKNGTGNIKEGKTEFNTGFSQGLAGTKDKIFYQKKLNLDLLTSDWKMLPIRIKYHFLEK